MTVNYVPILPVWLIVLIAVGLLALLVHGCTVLVAKRVPVRWIAILAALRVVIILVLTIALLRPVITRQRDMTLDPDLLVMVDVSRTMGQPAAGSSGNDLTQVKSMLDAAGDSGLIERLGEQFNVQWFAFDSEAWATDGPGDASKHVSDEPARYAQSLRTARQVHAEQRRADGAPAAGSTRVLLIGAGHDQGSSDAVSVAQELGMQTDVLMPDFDETTMAGTDEVRIAQAQAPRQVLLGAELRLMVTLVRDDAAADQTVWLDLVENGTGVQRYRLNMAAGDRDAQMNVSYRPSEAGLHRYTLHLAESETAPPPRAPAQTEGEAVAEGEGDAEAEAEGEAGGEVEVAAAQDAAEATDEPAMSLSVQVMHQQSEVLVLEDSYRWSFRYMRRLIEDDPHFNLTAFIARSRSSFVQFAEPQRRVNLAGVPQSAAELGWFDVIVLGDVDPARWPSKMIDALRYMVVEEGKSLVVLAGPNLGKLTQPRFRALANLLPVELSSNSAQPLEGPIPVRLGSEASGSTFFFQPDAEGRALWRNLPEMDQIYPPIRKKPAATVLLEAADKGNQFGPLIVMAEHTVGSGRVLYVGTDTLWKWQMLGAQTESSLTAHDVFWQQVLRSMSPDRRGREAASLQLIPEASRLRAGDSIRLAAVLSSQQPVNDVKLSGQATFASGATASLSFSPDPTESGRYLAMWHASEPGPVKLSVDAEAGGRTLAQSVAGLEVEPAPAEHGINRDALLRIARGTGGQVVDLSNAETWPHADPEQRYSAQMVQRFDLWDNFALLLLLVALLATDWLLRLLRGYV